MRPKEKAKELVEKFADYADNLFDKNLNLTPIIAAKKCALIAVDEILTLNVFEDYSDWTNTIEYWEEVRQEIENYD